MKRFGKKGVWRILEVPIRWILIVAIAVGLYFALSYFSGLNISRPNVKGIAASLGINLLEELPLPKELGGLSLPKAKPQVAARVALLADSHEDNRNLKTALDRVRGKKIDFAIHLGDLSRVGTESELQLARAVLDEGGLQYFVIPGDHDIWASQGILNFENTFGEPYQSFEFKKIEFILLDNSDTALGIEEEQFSWLRAELAAARGQGPIFVFAHVPPYHPSSPRAMGEKSTVVREQAKELSRLLKDTGVEAIFCGDIHNSGNYTDPETGLDIHVIGALTTERNLQTPRFSILTIYEGGEYELEEMEL